MKSKLIFFALLLLTVFPMSSCRNCAISGKERDSTSFSLNRLYEDDSSRLRFTPDKEERPSGYEEVSEKWSMDFITQAR